MKRVISFLLAVTMLLSLMSALDFSAMADDVIEVSTIEQLYNVRDDLTANYKLMNDIDLTAATAKGGDWDYYGNGWNPIGSKNVYSNAAFSGVFDGNGHTIKGLRINVTSLPSGTGAIYAGLFANVSGTVKNLTIEGEVGFNESYSTYLGSVAGYCSGTIENCHNLTTITNSGSSNSSDTKVYVGGIAGYVSKGTVRTSSNRGNVKTHVYYCYSYSGGIAGYINGGTISGCFNAGDITSTHGSNNIVYASGIAGAAENSPTVTNCYNCGELKSDIYSGGIVENGAKISNCYNVGKLTGVTSRHAIGYGTSTNCYYLSGVGTTNTGATSLTAAQMKLQSMYKGFDFDNIWAIYFNSEYIYPQLKNNTQETRTLNSVSLSSLPDKAEYTQGENLNTTGCQIKFEYDTGDEYVDVTSDMVTGYNSNNIGTQTLTVNYKNRTFNFDVVVKEKVIEYVEISTIEDLYFIRNDLSANYKLMNDIDLTAATAAGGDWNYYSNGWNPIGSKNVYSNAAFSGIFDGNGHTIKGLRINVTYLPSGTGTVYAGLFANVSGTVKNLTIEGTVGFNESNITYLGSVAGYCSGTIENCHNLTTITNNGNSSSDANVFVGGIAGYVSKGTVRTSSNRGNVKTPVNRGNCYTGGIAGQINGGTISGCFNEGNIDSIRTNNYEYSYVGGIAGYAQNSPTVTNCYNTGELNSNSYAGGIVENGAKISNCYNVGKVTGGYRHAIGSGTSTNCYYLSGVGTTDTGATSLTELQMKNQTMYSGFDFDSVWEIDSNCDYPYPQLKTNRQSTNHLLSVELKSAPTKTEYIVGQDIDLSGCEILETYESGTKTINVTAKMISGYNKNEIGTQTISVSHRGRELAFDVSVNDKAVEKITVTAQPTKTTYFAGEEFDPAGMVITASYNNNTSEVVTNYSITAITPSIGEQILTVTYGGKNAYVTVNVAEKALTGIKVTSNPHKLTYTIGEQFNTLGLEVTAMYNDGTSEIIDDYVVANLPEEVGVTNAVISYKGFTTAVEVVIKDRVATKIEVTTMPVKTEYFAGEAFDATGLVVTLIYDNNTSERIKNYTLSGFGNSKEINTVTVRYNDFTTSFNVTIHTPEDEYVTVKTPTCTEQGQKVKYCADCGMVIAEESIPVVAHSYEANVVNPTCTSQGYTKYTCSVCHDSYNEDYTDVLGHSETTLHGKDATCSENGLTDGVICSKCQTVIVEQKVIPRKVHDYVSQVISVPTCKTLGVTEYVCRYCGYSYELYEDMLDHNWDNGTIIKPATCLEAGEKEYRCRHCGDKRSESVAKLAHTPAAAVKENEKSATCIAKGSYDSVVYCSDCNTELSRETKELKNVDHTPTIDKAVTPTCTKAGLTAGSHCLVCGYVIEEQAVVPATGHSCTTSLTKPTCKNKGYTTHTCTVCGESFVDSYTDVTDAHDYKATITTPATCSIEGVKTFTCSVCGDKYTEAIPMIAHKTVNNESIAPTCTKYGLSGGKYCSACGKVFETQERIDPLGHDFGSVVTPATLTANGVITHPCSRCDKEGESEVIYAPKTFALAKTSYVYSGKAIAPAVTVKDSKGKALVKGTDYDVEYKNNVGIGTASVVITFAGKYEGTKTLTFTILPKGTTVKATAAKKAFTAKWTKVAGVTGYQVQYSTNAKFSKAVTKTVKGAGKTSLAVKSLKGGAKYYVRVRTYKTIGGKNYYSAWSAAKAITTKK